MIPAKAVSKARVSGASPPPKPAALGSAAAEAPTQPKAGTRSPAPQTAAATLTNADLRKQGIDASTVTRWVRDGLLARTDEWGEYTPTEVMDPDLRSRLMRGR